MTITIELPDAIELQVETRAERAGVSVSEYLSRVVKAYRAERRPLLP